MRLRTSHELTFDDYLEIQQLYATYAHTIDSGEGQGRAWVNTFTPDGYPDSLVKTAEGWRFKKRVVVFDTVPTVR